MQVHIIGSSGYIGSQLLSYWGTSIPIMRYSPLPTLGENLLELTKPDTFNFSAILPGDYVIFLAAISSPDICEKQYEFAYSINVTGTKEYINRFIEKKANVLFFSSDAVVGTTLKASDENSECHPFGSYARMKREIEDTFMNIPQFKVFRLSYVFSKDDKFTRYLNQCDKDGKIAEVFDALKRNVIYLYDILEAVKKLEGRFFEFSNNIFNLSGLELLSRKDLAGIYQRNISPNFQYRIIDPPTGFFDARPNVIETKSLYLPTLLGRDVTLISDAFLREYSKDF